MVQVMRSFVFTQFFYTILIQLGIVRQPTDSVFAWSFYSPVGNSLWKWLGDARTKLEMRSMTDWNFWDVAIKPVVAFFEGFVCSAIFFPEVEINSISPVLMDAPVAGNRTGIRGGCSVFASRSCCRLSHFSYVCNNRWDVLITPYSSLPSARNYLALCFFLLEFLSRRKKSSWQVRWNDGKEPTRLPSLGGYARSDKNSFFLSRTKNGQFFRAMQNSLSVCYSRRIKVFLLLCEL